MKFFLATTAPLLILLAGCYGPAMPTTDPNNPQDMSIPVPDGEESGVRRPSQPKSQSEETPTFD